MALRRAATASTQFFTKFLSPKYASPRFSPLPPSFSSTTAEAPSSSSGKEENDSDDTNTPSSPQKFKMENPFQSVGPRNVIEVDEVKAGTLVRVAMPGVGDDGFRVWAENDTVFFAGKGEMECKTDDSARMYGGSLEFRSELHRADGVKAEMKNGILRLVVPNVDGAET